MTQNTLQRSKIYAELFSDEEMISAFGKLNPSIKERTAHFFDLWCEWRNNRIKFNERINTNDSHVIKARLKQFGYRDLWDYQIRNNEIRFRDQELIAFFKMAVGDIVRIV